MDKDLLKARTESVNDIVLSFIPKASDHLEYITEAFVYSVRAGGKRLRPLLMQEAFMLFSDGRDEKIIHPFMAAIEFIHTYSLVHDDLPAMDNDLLRRGQPSTFAKYGEAFGILAGDALLNEAFTIALKAVLEADPANVPSMVKGLYILSEKAGMRGMIGGQCLDVYSEKFDDLSIEKTQLEFIFANKTAALLEAALMTGASVAGADDSYISMTEELGYNLGMAFQIRDDILDVISTDEVLGKPVGSDAENGKITAVTLYGLEGAQNLVNDYSAKAADIINKFPGDTAFLRELTDYLINRDY
ncbi:MAG: polyprenyl synthetase family protein [Parasporobacterium sp.]|nr:polyprenyl synthetase family protein [Parasporobacterium sp.]